MRLPLVYPDGVDGTSPDRGLATTDINNEGAAGCCSAHSCVSGIHFWPGRRAVRLLRMALHGGVEVTCRDRVDSKVLE